MLFTLARGAFILLLGFVLAGCFETPDPQQDEQKNPYFMAGRERAAAHDFKGAIEAFEKALEVNPRSAHAPIELALLHEEHDEQEYHIVSAMYHYKRTIDLRPNGYPSDNARVRMAGCKQELVKAESLAPVYQNTLRELEKLKQDNQFYRRQIEQLQAQLTNRPAAQIVSNQNRLITPGPRPPTNRTDTLANNRDSLPPRDGTRITPLPPPAARSHTVQKGETFAAISRRYNVKLEKLMALNPALEPKRLKPGQIVNLP